MGTMGGTVVWRTAGSGAEDDHAVARGVSAVAGGRGSDGGEPDAIGVLPADAGRGRGCGAGPETETAECDLRGRSSGVAAAAQLVRAAWGDACAGEYVRDHGDDGACE